jgi:hypothetical protein
MVSPLPNQVLRIKRKRNQEPLDAFGKIYFFLFFKKRFT